MEGESDEQVGGELQSATSSAGCFMQGWRNAIATLLLLLLLLSSQNYRPPSVDMTVQNDALSATHRRRQATPIQMTIKQRATPLHETATIDNIAENTQCHSIYFD